MSDEDPKTLAEYLSRFLADPDFVFRPHAHHNTDGDLLHVFLTDDSYYVRPAGHGLDLHLRRGDDAVVGLTLWNWSKLNRADGDTP